MAVKYELMAKTGSYTDRTGNEKARWTKCGILLEKDGKTSIKLEALPVNFDGWLSCFEPRPKDDKPAKPQKQIDDDTDVPF